MPPSRFYNGEGLESHELGSVPFSQRYQQSNNNSHLIRSGDHNAFGDDSDSEDHQHQQNEGEEEEEEEDENQEFDVYKDFNNQGVRYASLLKPSNDESKNGHEEFEDGSISQSDGIQPPGLHSEKHPQGRGNRSSVDHVISTSDSPTNARFRTDRNDQLKNYSKSPTRGKFSQWKNGTNRWRIGSIIAFMALGCIGVVAYFMVPRQPFISFETPVSLNNMTDNNLIFSAKNPTNFSFDAQLQMSLDGRGSYLPTLIRDFKVTVNDIGSTPNSVKVGSGKRNKGFTCSSHDITPVSLDVHFLYGAKDPSDALWQQWRKACGNIGESTVNGTITRPSLQLYVFISFKVIGLIGTKYDSIQLNNVGCPAELSANAPSF